jgi:hypothetical protein
MNIDQPGMLPGCCKVMFSIKIRNFIDALYKRPAYTSIWSLQLKGVKEVHMKVLVSLSQGTRTIDARSVNRVTYNWLAIYVKAIRQSPLQSKG